MRALVIADESFASREHAMLWRLEVGLADEGVRVIHAIPSQLASGGHTEVFSQRVPYLDRGLPLTLGMRAAAVVRELERIAESERPADVVHAWGEGCWEIARQIATLTGAALVLEVWREGLAPRACSAAKSMRTGDPDDVPVLLAAPGPATERILREQAPGVPVRMIPWGVHTPATVRSVLEPGRAPSIVVSDSSAGLDPVIRALTGIARVLEGHPDVMVFVEADAASRKRLWSLVRKLGLTGRVTLTPDLEARRDLAMRADVLLVPGACGEHRSIVADAMAHAMVVIAEPDPDVALLSDPRITRPARGGDATAWADALAWALDQPGEARAMADAAREHVRASCRASTQVSAVVDAYEWLSAREPLPFTPGEVR